MFRKSLVWTVVLIVPVVTGCTSLRLTEPLARDRQPSSPSSAAAVLLVSQETSAALAVQELPVPKIVGKNGDDKNGHDKKDEAAAPKEKITLPLAIQLCITQNFRLHVGAEKIHQAEADLITASLIPNMSLFADYQLIPLQRADFDNQLGPPQADVMLTIPIDWLVFGKRVAQMQAARLGIEVSNADYADLHRVQVGRTVDAFYEVLVNEANFKLAERNLEELEEIEKMTEELVKNKKADRLDLDRIKLAVLEAVLDRHERERAFEVAKAKLRPFIGRTAADPDYEVVGELNITAVVPPPKLAEAVALADAHRPDLISDQHDIARAHAMVKVEQRKAKPQVAVIPGVSYQNQEHITGFRNGSLFDIGISTTLPFTDRNQGNIRKARAQANEMLHTYRADRADALAEVETAVINYEDAVEHLSQFNSPVTLKAAHDLRKNMAAAYRAGDRKLYELLSAHQAYRDRLAHVVEFQNDYWRNLNRLNMAVGLNAYDQAKGATQPAGKEMNKK